MGERGNDEGRGRGRGGRGGPGHGRRHGGRRSKADRGDTRAAILALLIEQPMHGYQIMQELDERTKGVWQPSAGSIYPSLQQLADEGLIVSDSQQGKKVFELTDEGRTAAEAVTETPPWERFAAESGSIDLRETMASLGGAARQVGRIGTLEQIKAADEIITEARRKIYQLLAE